MKNEVKVVDPELELFKERAAMFAIWLVTLVICLLIGLGIYSGPIAIGVSVSAMVVYYKKTQKIEVVK
ncbi:MAG: hypothetical protein WC009_07880 [Methylotenera sp.]